MLAPHRVEPFLSKARELLIICDQYVRKFAMDTPLEVLHCIPVFKHCLYFYSSCNQNHECSNAGILPGCQTNHLNGFCDLHKELDTPRLLCESWGLKKDKANQMVDKISVAQPGGQHEKGEVTPQMI